MAENLTVKKIDSLKREVKNLENVAVIAMENLESELTQYMTENNIDINESGKTIEIYSMSRRDLSDDIRKLNLFNCESARRFKNEA